VRDKDGERVRVAVGVCEEEPVIDDVGEGEAVIVEVALGQTPFAPTTQVTDGVGERVGVGVGVDVGVCVCVDVCVCVCVCVGVCEGVSEMDGLDGVGVFVGVIERVGVNDGVGGGGMDHE